MQSTIRSSPFYNSRNTEKPTRFISAKARFGEAPQKNTQNHRVFEPIKTLYRKKNGITATEKPQSRPSTYTKDTENVNTTKAASDRDSHQSKDNVGHVFERNKFANTIGEPYIKNNVPKSFPVISDKRSISHQIQLPNSARAPTDYYPSPAVLQRNARKQIRANLELYFRKKELASRYTKLRPSSTSSSKVRYDSPRTENTFIHSENQRFQGHFTTSGYHPETPPSEPFTIVGSHYTGDQIAQKPAASATLANLSTPKASSEYFDCHKVCSIESTKLVAEKDTSSSGTLTKTSKGTKKSSSKSRINTHWSFGPPSDNLAVPFEDTRKLISLDPVFVASPRRRLISSPLNHRRRLVNRCNRPTKTMVTTMMIPRYAQKS